ncbi:MAG TPA: VWA domain-containing protein [Streptosporangiaceae bacterium]
MRGGGLLYIEELNRVPEETINVLLTVMSEAEINVPRLGRIPADPSFRLVAAMNPYDSVGTSRLSTALYDRTCRVSVGYQEAETERQIVRLSATSAKPGLIAEAVDLTRATRDHPDLRSGASVRGAIDYARLVPELAGLRAVPDGDWQAGLDAALTTLSGRVRLHESCRRSADDVIEEIFRRVRTVEPDGDAAGGGQGDMGGRAVPPLAGGSRGVVPPGPARPSPKSGRRDAATTGRRELGRHARFAELSPEVGLLDEQAARRALGEDPAAFELLAAMTVATDERLREAAIRLSSALVLERARAGRTSMRGVSRLRPARGALDGDLDIDASVEGVSAARTEARPVAHDDLTTVQWARPRTAFAVVVDRSGSMSGGRLTAAATVAAACALRSPAEHAVLSFAGTVDVIRPLASDIPPAAVAERLLRLRGHGVTRLAAALQVAGEQLAQARARRRVVVLLSDCRSTDEDDTEQTARSLPELIILAPADDHDQAAHLAEVAGARWAVLAHPLEAAAVLDRLLQARAG